MAKRKDGGESIGDVLIALRVALGSQVAVARALGMSPKSLQRFESGAATPPVARRAAMVRALVGAVDYALIARFGVALDVPQALWPAPPAGVMAAGAAMATPLEASLDLAVLVAAERHELPATRARKAVIDVLGRMVELGVDAKTAQGVLTVVAGRREGARSRQEG